MSEDKTDTAGPQAPEGEDGADMRTENAGSTPHPPAPEEQQESPGDTQPGIVTDLPTERGTESEDPAPLEAPPTSVQNPSRDVEQPMGYPSYVHPEAAVQQQQQQQQQQLPLTINQVAILASAQNKLPVSKVKSIVLRSGRHTESSVQKTGKWYKNDNYVDKDSYSWKNMPLFEDHQCHLWTPSGTVRTAYKK